MVYAETAMNRHSYQYDYLAQIAGSPNGGTDGVLLLEPRHE